MLWLGAKINKDYAWELSMFHKYRSFKDGVDFFNFIINWDRYLADHSPKFEITLRILNFTIIEFNIYYRWHRNDLDADVFPDNDLCKSKPPFSTSINSDTTMKP